MLPQSGEILLFFFDGLSGVGDGVVGLVMICAGSMLAVFCLRSCVMVDLVESCRVSGGGISISTKGTGPRIAVGRSSGRRLAALVWQGHSPACVCGGGGGGEGRRQRGDKGRLLLPTPFLSKRW